jgi:hypothetical protein
MTRDLYSSDLLRRMKPSNLFAIRARMGGLCMVLLALAAGPAAGAVLDAIGVTVLRTVTTNLDGTGIGVAHPEASLSTNFPTFEVNPASVGRPAGLFAYFSTNGVATNYPNAVGDESGHADGVGQNFYGLTTGVATNVAHVDNYDADYFFNQYIFTDTPVAIAGRIANQSFIFNGITISDQQMVDYYYDMYAAQYGTLFVSGVGNGGPVNTPATCYNGIGVGVIDGGSSIGPTLDNGRCKPDLVAFGGATSFSTPYVSGAAAVLMQAALRGDGGGDTNAASDSRNLKALLLNGAIKPAGWTNAPNFPLDARYGAGVLNVFNAYAQLAGGQHGAIESSSVATNATHPPGASLANVPVSSGWDFSTLSSTPGTDAIQHYYFKLTNSFHGGSFSATATLVWNRQTNQTAINDLDLHLYDTATSNVVAQSVSFVNNVEHLYVTNLPPGRYDLQVWKAGGDAGNGNVTPDETYALAFEFFSPSLQIAASGTNALVSWPVYPDGFVLQASTNLASPSAWSTLAVTPAITNNQNRVSVPVDGGSLFFRLKRP